MSTTINTIKTLDDAIVKLGKNHPYVIAYDSMNNVDECNADILAFVELRIIAAALNDGWQPTYADDEVRYYPWFCLYTKEEYDRLDDDEKEMCCRVVGRSYSYASAGGGLVYASASNASSYSYAHNGSRLAFKTRELALYAGKQFIYKWCDFLF